MPTTPPIFTRCHWAKAKFDAQGTGNGPSNIHLLEHHLADVGACFEALLHQPTIRRRLAASGGLDDLDEATTARLSVFAALHDIGKLSASFQAKIWPADSIPPPLRSFIRDASHTRDLAPVLSGDDTATGNWFFDALNWDDFLTWDDMDGETACGLLVATFSHHGIPLRLAGGRGRNSRIWQDYGDLSPRECAERIGRLTRKWYPQAFRDDAPPLPSTPAFQHFFLGLCTLADWIGSNEDWFSFVDTPQDDYINVAKANAKRAIAEIGLDISEQRNSFAANGAPAFGSLFSSDAQPEGFQPNAIQQATQDTPLDEPVVIIESETGSGKTEAALWRFARMYERGLVDGIYFALPTRAAAAQIYGRVERFTANLFAGQDAPPVVLAVPGYEADADAAKVEMPEYDEPAAGERHHDKPWASENAKRYLAAQVAVGTIDQALMGALKVRHAHLRAACLARNLLVVDEVHASDTYMRRILEALLQAHVAAGGYALLMSATLGSDARRRLLAAAGQATAIDTLSLDAAKAVPYPSITSGGAGTARVQENGRPKNVSMAARGVMNDFDAAAGEALDAARAGAKVLVIRNTVGNAIETQRALEALAGDDTGLLFQCGDVVALHHGRFAAPDRRKLDRAVEDALGRNAERDAGCVVVGTQTLEQSLDIDADLLITDLCPMDVLLQRIGRLHRHARNDRPAGYRTPRCIVLTPDTDLSPLLESGQGANGLGPQGRVYEDLRILEATLRLIGEYREWEIPAMNRELVERATHPDMLEKIVSEFGEDWSEHAINVDGENIADGLTARGAIIRRDRSFFVNNREVLFGSHEEKIRTRLGDDRVDIAFAASPDSPFGQPGEIDKLALSVRWLGAEEPPDSVEASVVEGGFEFAVWSRHFMYDRLGLRRL